MILGIDPGISGALAFLTPHELVVEDIPILKTKKGTKIQTTIDAYALGRIIDAKKITHCYIESVHAMRGQGVSSSFNFGKSLGIIIGIVAANFIPMTLVTPQEWKKALRVPADKDGARARASELMPQYNESWRLKKHDGRAEAALIAYWGSLRQEPVQTTSQ